MRRKSPYQSPPPRKIVKRKINKKRIAMLILIPILFILAGGVAYAAHLYTSAEEAINNSHVTDTREMSALRDEVVDPVEDNVSILFMGVDDSDTRDEVNSRSDALILATFNKEEHSVELLSIPRDSYVYVPEVGYQTKITHAHAYGGAQATVATVEQFLNVPVDYYVELNFNAFMDVIDTLGGIEVEVPYELYEQNSEDEADAIHLEEGLQTLDGEEALALARTRHYDNDIERGKRQQEIIKAMVEKAASAGSILKYDDLIQNVGDNMTTSLTFDQLKSFISYGTSTDLTINTLNLDGTGGKLSDGLWYYQVDPTSLADVQAELREHLDLDPAAADTDSIETDESGVYDDDVDGDGTPYTTESGTSGTSSESGYDSSAYEDDTATDGSSSYDSGASSEGSSSYDSGASSDGTSSYDSSTSTDSSAATDDGTSTSSYSGQ